MTRKTMILSLAGGIDEVSPALAVKKGRARSAVNHEVVDNGYARIGGYERFDGRTSPTDAPFWIMTATITEMFLASIREGITLTGEDSGATAVVLLPVELGAVPYATPLAVRDLVGEFRTGEGIIHPGSLATPPFVMGTVTLIAQEGGSDSPDPFEAAASVARRDLARSLIQPIPGGGPVRGVLEYGGDVYAWADDADETAGHCWRATATGWVEVGTGCRRLPFDHGQATIPTGATITGLTTGATAVVKRVVVQSGDVDADDATGYLVTTDGLGAFVAEDIAIGATTVAHLTSGGAPVTFPPGGRYRFVQHNFYGGPDTHRAYGVNGVGNAFEFDGETVSPIESGSDAFPSRIAVHNEHLVLGRSGGIDISSTGEPLLFDASLGAASIEVGSNVTDLLTVSGATAILAEQSITVLSGKSSADFVKDTLTDSAGALPDTAQVVGTGLYVDNRGLRSLTATQAYGKFTMGTLSNDVRVTMAAKKKLGLLPVASMVVGTKNQYRLIYSDGSGISFYMGRKAPEPMAFEWDMIPFCTSVTAVEASEERLFVGSVDGFVYQVDKGKSFDGEPIAAYIQFPYHHDGSPTLLKRWMKARLELECGPSTVIGIAGLYDYSNDEQPMSAADSVTAQGGGGLWGIANWGGFYWGAAVYGAVESDDLDGAGANMSLILHSNSADTAAYVLQAVMIDYSLRGQKR